MAKNLIPEVCKLLGVEVGEEFEFDVGFKRSMKIDEDGWILEPNESGKWECNGVYTLLDLLRTPCCIIKLPWKPKDREEFWSFCFSSNRFLMVVTRYWNSKDIDHLALYQTGWVYRTKEEAETALPAIAKELGVEYEL